MEDPVIIAYSFTINGHAEGEIDVQINKKGEQLPLRANSVYFDRTGKFLRVKKK